MSNADLLRRSLAAVWHPCTQMKQHAEAAEAARRCRWSRMARGDGAWLYDFDGKRYLDGISSWWVNLFGHCNPRINAGIARPARKSSNTSCSPASRTEPVVELSERLSALTGNALGHCFYASDGASATEIALKMSFH
jgi:adenosylmethionine-8-amino-7-oxononanoate aminotransferase